MLIKHPPHSKKRKRLVPSACFGERFFSVNLLCFLAVKPRHTQPLSHQGWLKSVPHSGTVLVSFTALTLYNR